jgi:hypothetical protein
LDNVCKRYKRNMKTEKEKKKRKENKEGPRGEPFGPEDETAHGPGSQNPNRYPFSSLSLAAM